MNPNDLPIKNGIIIPGKELKITASRAGGPGGQHVNKTSTAITVRWNVKKTQALNEAQKDRVLTKLQSRLTSEGDLIVRSNSSRSQQKNKEAALEHLASIIRKALHTPKKRMRTRISKAAQKERLRSKAQRSMIKKLRSTKFSDYDWLLIVFLFASLQIVLLARLFITISTLLISSCIGRRTR